MNRRELLRRTVFAATALTGAMLPLLSRRAQADELPHVSKDDPTAKALKYTEDATHSERTDTAASCHTCRFFKGSGSTPWAPCEMFPGRAVNANGWCSLWTKKA